MFLRGLVGAGAALGAGYGATLSTQRNFVEKCTKDRRSVFTFEPSDCKPVNPLVNSAVGIASGTAAGAVGGAMVSGISTALTGGAIVNGLSTVLKSNPKFFIPASLVLVAAGATAGICVNKYNERKMGKK